MCTFCSVKCCFVFFNVLFLASGVTLIAIGAKQHSTYAQLGEFAGKSLSKITIVLIAVGAAITLVSILGLLGAFFNNYNMVSCFICILIIIIILEIITGALFYVVRNRTLLLKGKGRMDYENKARRVIHEYRPEKRHAIDRIQEKFKCCGADGPSDWSKSVGWKKHEAVPDTCCVVKKRDCGQHKDKVRSKGCIPAIKEFLMKNLVWVGAICITLGLAEVLGVIVGMCFCMNIKRKSYESMS